MTTVNISADQWQGISYPNYVNTMTANLSTIENGLSRNFGFIHWDCSSVPSTAVISAASVNIVAGGGGQMVGPAQYTDWYVANSAWWGQSYATCAAITVGAYVATTYHTNSIIGLISTAISSGQVVAWRSANNGIVSRDRQGPNDPYGHNDSMSPTVAYVSVTYTIAPGAPGAFTFPAAGGAYGAGTTLAVAWADATDADTTVSLLVYELSYWNGSAWTVLTTTAANVKTYNWDTSGLPGRTDYQLRVRAKDPDNNFGPYTTLGAFTLTSGMHMIV